MAMEASTSTEDCCSICLESMGSNCDRTVVRLRCSHVFHLDCIGSTFNAIGAMRCPNCRRYENGTWRRFPRSGTVVNINMAGDVPAVQIELPNITPSVLHQMLAQHRARQVILRRANSSTTTTPVNAARTTGSRGESGRHPVNVSSSGSDRSGGNGDQNNNITYLSPINSPSPAVLSMASSGRREPTRTQGNEAIMIPPAGHVRGWAPVIILLAFLSAIILLLEN